MKVELLEHTEQPDRLVCKAARNDYSDDWIGNQTFAEIMEDIDGEGIHEKMENLIRHLLDRGHFGPCEHCSFTFSIEGVSRSCMAQLTRHRHASFDVQSMRYVSFEDGSADDLVKTPPKVNSSEIGRNSEMDEGIAENVDEDDQIKNVRQQIFKQAIKDSVLRYRELLDWGLPPEDARFVLPIGTKVNIVFTVNLRTLLHIADMRGEADSQWEIRELTEKILDLTEEVAPVTMKVYNEELRGRKNRLAP